MKQLFHISQLHRTQGKSTVSLFQWNTTLHLISKVLSRKREISKQERTQESHDQLYKARKKETGWYKEPEYSCSSCFSSSFHSSLLSSLPSPLYLRKWERWCKTCVNQRLPPSCWYSLSKLRLEVQLPLLIEAAGRTESPSCAGAACWTIAPAAGWKSLETYKYQRSYAYAKAQKSSTLHFFFSDQSLRDDESCVKWVKSGGCMLNFMHANLMDNFLQCRIPALLRQ